MYILLLMLNNTFYNYLFFYKYKFTDQFKYPIKFSYILNKLNNWPNNLVLLFNTATICFSMIAKLIKLTYKWSFY